MIAIEKTSGEIIKGKDNYIHADIVSLNPIQWKDVKSCGFVNEDNEYIASYRPGIK